jgi:predicted Zn-dependent protease
MLALLLAVTVAPRAASQSASPAELGPETAALFQDALAAQQRRDLQGAEKSYRVLLTSMPDYLPARLNLGIVLDAENKTVDALAAFDAVRTRQPTFPAAQMFAGIEEVRLGRLADALGSLHLATEQSASDPRCWFWLARANFALGNAAEGKAALDKVLAISPDDASALYLLAQYQISAQDLNGAERVLTGLATRYPTVPDFHQSLGSVYYMEARLDKAEDEYRIQLRMDSGNPQALSMIGVILLDRGQAKDAEPYLAKGLEANPGIAYLQRKMGQALLESDAPEQAIPHLRQALALDAQDATAHFLLWKAFNAMGRKPEASAELDAFRKLQSHSPANAERQGLPPLNPGHP